MLAGYKQWCVFTDDNCSRLRKLVAAKSKEFPVKQLSMAKEVGLDQGVITNWLKGEPRSKNENERCYYKVLLWCYNEGWLDQRERPWFVELASVMGVSHYDLKTLRSSIEGNYVVYRYSLLERGEILRGSLKIVLQDEFFASREVYRIRHSDGRVDEYARSGGLIRRDGASYVLVSRKDDPGARAELQLVNLVAHGGHYRGFLTDWHGPNFYCTGVYVVKLPEQCEVPDQDIGTLKPDDLIGIDKGAYKFLTRAFAVEDYLTLPFQGR